MASSLPAVDPMTAIVRIDPVTCPAFKEHVAVSFDGLRRYQYAQQLKLNEETLKAEECLGAKDVLDVRLNSAVKAVEDNEAWRRYAPLGIVVSFILGVAGGILAAVAVGR